MLLDFLKEQVTILLDPISHFPLLHLPLVVNRVVAKSTEGLERPILDTILVPIGFLYKVFTIQVVPLHFFRGGVFHRIVNNLLERVGVFQVFIAGEIPSSPPPSSQTLA